MFRCECLLLCVCRVKTGLLCLLQVGLSRSLAPSLACSLADDTFLFLIQPISHLLTPVQGAGLPVAQPV